MIWLILILATALRLIKLDQSLWLDESINVLAARDLGLWQLITSYSIGDFHPPLYFAILWSWGHIFGFSEISVRMPSVILGVGTVFITYLLGKELFSKKAGLIAALLLSLGPLHVYYSGEARMYSLAAFSVSLSFYFFIMLLKSKKYFYYYVLSVLLVLYSDYLPYLAFFSQGVYLVLFEREQVKKFFVAYGVALLAFIPWLFIFPQQLINGQQTAINVPGWAKVVGGSNMKNVLLVFVKTLVGRVRLENIITYGLIVLPVAITYGYLILKAILYDKKTYLIVLWFILPIGLAFITSFFIPVLSYFRMLFVLPALYILAAKGLEHIDKNWSRILLGGLIIFSSGCLVAYYFNPQFQRENWKGLTTFLKNNSDLQTLTLFEDTNFPAPYKYYQQPINALGALNKFPADTISDSKNIDFNKYRKIYLVDYLVEIADPNRIADKNLTNKGWKVVDVHDFNGVGLVYEYTRQN